MIPAYAPSIQEWMRQVSASVNPLLFQSAAIAPVAGSVAGINLVYDDAAYPAAKLGGLWTAATIFNYVFNKTFGANDGAANAPCVSLLATANNAGSPGDSVALMGIGQVSASNKSVFGANIITFSSGGAIGVKMVGCEIDVQPQAGAATSGGGLYINAFTMTFPGPAIYFEGLSGGKWSTGINVGNLSDTGSGISPAPGTPRMGTLLDSGTATYVIDAIKLNNTHRIRFLGASGNPALLYVDGSNFFHAVVPSGGWVFRDNTDTISLASFDTSGNLNLQNGGTVMFASALSSTTAAAGAAALPANPVGFVTMSVGGTNRKIPYYA